MMYFNFQSNIKYPEFKVDINELKFVTNNIEDIFTRHESFTSDDIIIIKPLIIDRKSY